MKTKTTELRKKSSTQLLKECWSFLTKLMTCQNLQNKLLNITVLFIWYLLASLKKMSFVGELYFILSSTYFSPLAILVSVWKKWFPTLLYYNVFLLLGRKPSLEKKLYLFKQILSWFSLVKIQIYLSRASGKWVSVKTVIVVIICWSTFKNQYHFLLWL